MSITVTTIGICDGCFTKSLVPPSDNPKAADWCAIYSINADGREARQFLRKPGRSGNLDAREVTVGQILEFSRDIKEGGKVIVWNRRYGRVLQVTPNSVVLDDLGRDVQSALNPVSTSAKSATPAPPESEWSIPNPSESRMDQVESPFHEPPRGADSTDRQEELAPSAHEVPDSKDVAVEPPTEQVRILRASSRNELVETIIDHWRRPFQAGRAVRDYRGNDLTGHSMKALEVKANLSDTKLYDLAKLDRLHPEIAALPLHQLPDTWQLNTLLKVPAAARIELWKEELAKTPSLSAKDLDATSLNAAVNRHDPDLQLAKSQKAFCAFMDSMVTIGISSEQCAPFYAAMTSLEGQLQAKSQ